jgi:hypothetical protein
MRSWASPAGSTSYAMVADGRDRPTAIVSSSRLSDPLDSSESR